MVVTCLQEGRMTERRVRHNAWLCMTLWRGSAQGWAVSTCCPAVVQWSRQCLSCVTNRAGVAIARSRLSQDHELVREVIASWAG